MKQPVKTISILLVVLSAVCILGTFRSFLVAGPSDAPTLLKNDLVIVNKSAYDLVVPFTRYKMVRISNPERGDMIICKIPDKDETEIYLKRVVGIPGDTIQLIQNKLIINGTLLDYEVFKKEDIMTSNPDYLGELIAREKGMGMDHLISFNTGPVGYANFGPVVIDRGNYFVLGDNRDNSIDSRMFGLISRTAIFGKYILTISNISQ